MWCKRGSVHVNHTVIVLFLMLHRNLCLHIFNDMTTSLNYSTLQNDTLARHARAAATCTCGLGFYPVRPRIVGGAETSEFEFPWRCGIFSKFINGFNAENGIRVIGYKFLCGCTIIGKEWILSAAHCALASPEKDTYVFAGGNKLGLTEEDGVQFIRVDKIYAHEGYDNVTHVHDISLMHMSQPFEFNHRVVPACLPYRFKRNKYYQEKVMVSGWGKQQHSSMDASETLRKAELPVLTTKQCRKYYKNKNKGEITDDMFCTFHPQRDACQGDSGGSIDFFDRGTQRYFAIGVTSWGVGCASPIYPGVYIKIAKYLKYIAEVTGEQFCVA